MHSRNVILGTPWLSTMTVAAWDAVVARELAKELYTYLYPYIEASVRIKGAQRTMETLEVFDDLFEVGPQLDNANPDVIRYGNSLLPISNAALRLEPQTPERSRQRASAIRAEMAGELERLLADEAVLT